MYFTSVTLSGSFVDEFREMREEDVVSHVLTARLRGCFGMLQSRVRCLEPLQQRCVEPRGEFVHEVFRVTAQ